MTDFVRISFGFPQKWYQDTADMHPIGCVNHAFLGLVPSPESETVSAELREAVVSGVLSAVSAATQGAAGGGIREASLLPLWAGGFALNAQVIHAWNAHGPAMSPLVKIVAPETTGEKMTLDQALTWGRKIALALGHALDCPILALQELMEQKGVEGVTAFLSETNDRAKRISFGDPATLNALFGNGLFASRREAQEIKAAIKIAEGDPLATQIVRSGRL